MVARGETARATFTDSVRIQFNQSKWDIDRTVADNDSILSGIHHRLNDIVNDSVYSIVNVRIYGGASPEGSEKFNRFLSEQRANAFFDYLNRYLTLSDEYKSFTYIGRDWELVLELANNDDKLPYKDETTALIADIIKEKNETGKEPSNSLTRLKRLRGGAPERYLYKNIYPLVRTSRIAIDYEILESKLAVVTRLSEPVTNVVDSVRMILVGEAPAVVPYIEPAEDTVYYCRPFYMDIRTNMLYDALLLPNIGADFYVGKNISIGGNWLYGWWSKNIRHRYWRAYGGELNARWWFGRKAHEKPLTGHHIGIHGQIYTYDFEFGNKGEMGGKPEDNLWNQFFWSAGVEYGFSLPIARRLNLDFTLGAGYSTGKYLKYVPQDTHYVWQSSHRRHYIGPTKVEIALVWLIGCDNYNIKKQKTKEIEEIKEIPEISTIQNIEDNRMTEEGGES